MFQGGIKNEHLSVALEPEAASLYCRLLPVQKMAKGATGGASSLSAFKPGAKYMILDAGGKVIQGFRFFSSLVGRSDPWSKKWWVIF